MNKITCGTVYEMLQEEMSATALPLSAKQLGLDLANIGAWFSVYVDNKYYMLLNKELSDYTIFNFLGMNYAKGIQELKEVLDSRGDILQIDYNHDNKYYEIWVRYFEDQRAHMYILFPCPEFVIEI